MILLINTSNLRKGGGIQVALSFIEECIRFSENEYHVFISPAISDQLKRKEYPGNFRFYFIPNTPSSLLHSVSTILQLRKLESKIKPDCAFTIFGPSYWTPRSPHMLGFAQGYYLYPESPFFKTLRPWPKLKIYFLKLVHCFFFKRNADYYYVESEDAKRRLSYILGVSQNKIFSFSNTHHSVFNNSMDANTFLTQNNKNEIRLVTISSYHLHKNLEIITKVIPLLKQKSSIKFLFVLTIENNLFQKKFMGFETDIVNIGPISISKCPEVYQKSDFVFIPTLIEIFSASYPEAMKMKKPILTSDLPFAHDICGNSVEYFDPLDPEDIVNKIIYLTSNINRQKELISRGEMRLKHFETPESRTKKLLETCAKICEREKGIE